MNDSCLQTPIRPRAETSKRVALITGGSRGLGLAMAKRFASSGAGVAIFARDPEALADARSEIESVASSGVLALECDVRTAEAIGESYRRVVSELGVERRGDDAVLFDPHRVVVDERAHIDLRARLEDARSPFPKALLEARIRKLEEEIAALRQEISSASIRLEHRPSRRY